MRVEGASALTVGEIAIARGRTQFVVLLIAGAIVVRDPVAMTAFCGLLVLLGAVLTLVASARAFVTIDEENKALTWRNVFRLLGKIEFAVLEMAFGVPCRVFLTLPNRRKPMEIFRAASRKLPNSLIAALVDQGVACHLKIGRRFVPIPVEHS